MKDAAAALDSIREDKAGFLERFLSQEDLQNLLEAWHRIASQPSLSTADGRFVSDPCLYRESAFARLAAHPIIAEAVRRVIGEFRLVRLQLVATTPNAEMPSRLENLEGFHLEHYAHSDVHALISRDTSAWVWVNFEELMIENGPLAVSLGSHHIDLGQHRLDPQQVLAATRLHVGEAGATVIFSGKTLHCATNNCSSAVRKGLSIGFVPAEPQDVTKRGDLDVCHLSVSDYQAFAALIDRPNYLVPHLSAK
jgi:ectoine hydroxylase-related dioxygenase (phytanoyl-CoA dioxygenase family)